MNACTHVLDAIFVTLCVYYRESLLLRCLRPDYEFAEKYFFLQKNYNFLFLLEEHLLIYLKKIAASSKLDNGEFWDFNYAERKGRNERMRDDA